MLDRVVKTKKVEIIVEVYLMRRRSPSARAVRYCRHVPLVPRQLISNGIRVKALIGRNVRRLMLRGFE